MRRFLYLASFVALLFSGKAISAQEYVSLYSGGVFLDDYSGEGPIGPIIANGTFRDGYLISAILGSEMNNGFRGELEFTFRANNGNDWTVFGTSPLSGTLSSFATMFNLTRDLDCLRVGYSTPYVGGGFGIAFIDGDMDTGFTTVSVSGTELAYQGIAGIRTQLLNNLDLLTEYRYFSTTDAHISTGNGLINESFVYATDNVFIGLRLSF